MLTNLKTTDSKPFGSKSKQVCKVAISQIDIATSEVLDFDIVGSEFTCCNEVIETLQKVNSDFEKKFSFPKNKEGGIGNYSPIDLLCRGLNSVVLDYETAKTIRLEKVVKYGNWVSTPSGIIRARDLNSSLNKLNASLLLETDVVKQTTLKTAIEGHKKAISDLMIAFPE